MTVTLVFWSMQMRWQWWVKCSSVVKKSFYINHINNLWTWCRESALLFNAKKTKVLIVDNKGGQTIIIEGQAVGMIGRLKYTGMILDMNFNEHSDYIYKTAIQVQCPEDGLHPTSRQVPFPTTSHTWKIT